MIHLETPELDQGYNRDNSLRIESAQEAKRIDRRIEQAWRDHPHRLVVASEHDFVEKALRALALIRAELPSCCHGHALITDRQVGDARG